MIRKPSTHIGIERCLFQSRAWLSLTGVAPQVYLLFANRVQKVEVGHRGNKQWRVTNSGELEFSYLEAKAKWGISNPRFARALSQLVERGFIDIVHPGGGLNGGAYQKDKSLYGLSERWRLWGTSGFKPATRPRGRPWPKTESAHENVVQQARIRARGP